MLPFANAWEARQLLRHATAIERLHRAENLRRYCPHAPWPKQRAFLDLECVEAFFGGAAAGGKSEALLMAALAYVHVPGYAALILRKDTQRLSLSGGLIPRAHEWFAGTPAQWNGQVRRWSFPTPGPPATISFGYLMDPTHKYRYGSSEYQYIAFDELTEFPEDDYLFLFSRLRKTKELFLPLRMRSASNPGNLGHAWVKNRFLSEDASPAEMATGQGGGNDSAILWRADRAYVPARIADNPAIDEAEYRANLAHLPPVYRERLMNGDWSVREEGLIRPQWLRYYTLGGPVLRLLDPGGATLAEVDERSCRRFATIDPAGTSADRAREARGRPPSWSVIQVWDVPPGELARFLVLRHVWRERVGFDGLCRALREIHAEWRPRPMLIEGERLGRAACDLLAHEIPLEPISTGGRDKVTRAAPLLARLERGEIFLPQYDNGWRPALEAEWLSWTGLDDETSDQIDAAAYAAAETDSRTPGPLTIERVFWKRE